MNIDQIYENLDIMRGMKRYKPPTEGYFPTSAEINTYSKSEEFKYMLPYFLWLDECLTPAQREEHKEALNTLRKIVEEQEGGR